MQPLPRKRIEPRGLSRVEAAHYLGISPSKFDELRKDGRIPPPRMIDGRKVWDVRDLDAAFEAFPLETVSEVEEDWSVAV
jgi:predicted DNA-binding transcriptional regulator AlpA